MGLDTATMRIGLDRFFEKMPTPLQVIRPLSDVRTIWGDPSLVMTPAQRRAYSARSPFWRCIACGKIHTFDESVAVLFASPCSCGNFEFESPVEAFIR